MPNNAPITIKDGQATPVDHVFNPKGQTQNGNEYVFRDTKSGVVEFGQIQITLSRRPDSSSSNTEKVELKIQRPEVVTQTVNGVSQSAVAYSDLFTGSFTVSKTSTAQNRTDLLAYAKNLLGTAFVTAMVVNGETIW